MDAKTLRPYFRSYNSLRCRDVRLVRPMIKKREPLGPSLFMINMPKA